jgi:hypothetical protein
MPDKLTDIAFDRLKASASEQVAATLDDIVDCCEEQGPARLIFCALQSVAKIGQHEHEHIVFISAEQSPPDEIEASTSIYVSHPTETDGHTDFAVWAYDHSGRLLGKVGWRRAIVEIDHSGTTPEISSSFLGRGRQGKDVQALRFTAAEIEADPWAAATMIVDWASWSFG